MSKFTHLIIFGAFLTASSAHAAKQQEIVEHKLLMDHGDGHLMDMDGGMVMGQNKDKLPGGCDKISGDEEITVRAGHKYSKKFPGTMFAFDKQEWRIKPCTRLTVHFINEDNIRHQWMMHGLPKYLYDKGMFHLEVTGPAKISGTLIVPKEDKTYLVHCDIAQHMEKGMKGQLVVGKGGGTFPSIPGLTDFAIPDNYGPTQIAATTSAQPAVTQPTAAQPLPAPQSSSNTGTFIIGLALGLFATPFAVSNFKQRFKGMSSKDVVIYGANLGKSLFDQAVHLAISLYRRFKK
ncbi:MULTISPECIES: cupredoxin domain-containing protein [unclassified Methylocaldum]|jgi:plastocyanin|uniref:cupredoxin domain-containing protein n=1 Tax=unclassified Methylocaldum TaxID=2622260 RepID=UPI001B7A726B|nr:MULTISPECIES: cupredoxin domain-containing protein [unclassified Methylocaldum]MBP1150165.1 plastocyanin [Methylocaldum sp. RMAD-M]